jgi:hypothetical protein
LFERQERRLLLGVLVILVVHVAIERPVAAASPLLGGLEAWRAADDATFHNVRGGRCGGRGVGCC